METRNCQNCKQSFVIEPDDFSFYEKMKVPAPTFCPSCRYQRRMAWRNDTSLYSRACDLCQNNVISMYAPGSGMIVYCNKCWWSDKWDPYSYGIEYDFNRPFFEQFNELMHQVPHIGLVNDNNISSIGCEYTGDCWFSKNCYMTFCAWKIENVHYSYFMNSGKDMMDCLAVLDTGEWMYECINSDRCYKTRNAEFSISNTDCAYLYDCRNCSDCFMCGGLRNKRYHFKNKEYSKEAYEEILKEYQLDTFLGSERAQKEFDEFILTVPRRYAYIFKCLNCTGDIIVNGKNTKECFHTDAPENSRYLQSCMSPVDCYDLTTSGELSESYEGVVIDHSNRNRFGLFSVKSQDLEYTMHCHSGKHLFGCVGLKKGEYSIFNKRYSKEEFEKITTSIRAQMMEIPYTDHKGNEYRYGEYFPIEFSSFGYNETVAPLAFPLSKVQANLYGYKWEDNIQKTISKETIQIQDIPDSINDIEDSIIEKVFACVECSRNYKIVKEELSFYRSMNLPLSRRCFYCRFERRLKRRNPFKLWHRTCMKEGCQNEFETSYAPDRPEIVFCENCYQQEIN